MVKFADREFFPDYYQIKTDIDDFYTRDKTFGKFINNGSAYLIEDRNTPRPWLQFLVNDKIFSCVSNTGRGFIRHIRGINVTKQWEHKTYHQIRDLAGDRKLLINDNGIEKDFFNEAEDFTSTVTPGFIYFDGKLGDLKIKVTMLVPEKEPCECWNVEVENQGAPREITLTATQDWFITYNFGQSLEYPKTVCEENLIKAQKEEVTAVFTASGELQCKTENYEEVDRCDQLNKLTKAILVNKCFVDKKYQWIVVSGACDEEGEYEEVIKYVNPEKYLEAEKSIRKFWDKLYDNLNCEIPDKNAEYFMNYWIKNQIRLTYRYDRGDRYVGYRDGLQDSWGCAFIEPEESVRKIVNTLSYMLPDGRCPRQYDLYTDSHDMRDFSDSIIWAADAVTAYIKETGDFSILDIQIPFLNGDEITSVEEHIFRGLNSLYTLRGKNGLIRIRRGDWFDGLGGMDKYGEDATSVWITIAAFYAQNVMRELYLQIGDTEKAEIMEKRSAEYKEIVNRVGWNGKWFTYAFHDDGEPVGSPENVEGKIFLNAQTWAMFTGIVDDPIKIDKMVRAINHMLLTPYGPLMFTPPYVYHGARSGRVQRMRPGECGNSAIYNHASTFKMTADLAIGDYEEALDTLIRILPNHPDTSDTIRTSEPYSVHMLMYGPYSDRFGLNNFSWFSANVAWLIHLTYEGMLGVKSGYNGLEIKPRVSRDWNSYKVNKMYRGTMYHFEFERDENEKGIWADGVKIEGNCVKSDAEECFVKVKF